MKNIVLSAVAVAAMSSFAVAGGDIAPIQEPVVVTPEVVEEVTDAGFYLGLGYGRISLDETYITSSTSQDVDTRDFDQLLIQAGYKFNSYVAVEGRYWVGMNDLDGVGYYNGDAYNETADLDAYGIYVKPMYPVTPEFNVYALLGYADSTFSRDYTVAGQVVSPEDLDLDGFSWGLGAAYTVNGNISIFADYVVLYDDTFDEYEGNNDSSDFTIDSVNVGVSYKF